MANHDSIVSSDKIKAIADAIRDKTHKSEKLTLDQMPQEIDSISGGGATPECGIVPTEYSSNGFVLSANSYGNVQSGACTHSTDGYINLDPHNYNPEATEPFPVSGDYSYSQCQMFSYLSTLNFVTLPTIIGADAFANCYWLNISELPEDLESIGADAFNSCYSLSVSEIPESVEYIGDYAFSDTCSPGTVCPSYDYTKSYSIGDAVYDEEYANVYTCIQNAPPGLAPHYDYWDYWVQGYYPELVGVYDSSIEYDDGTIVYYENPHGSDGVYTTYTYTDSGSQIWIPEYCPDVIGVYDPNYTYHVGDVVVMEYGGEMWAYTCITDNPQYQPDSGYDWVSEYCPNILGGYDPTVEYHIGDVVGISSDSDYSIYTAITPSQDVDPEYDYHGEHWTYGYFPLLQGEYSSSKTYAVGDVIIDTDSSGGIIYTCISPVTSPEEIDYSKWAQGYYPEILGIWDENATYHPGDVVAIEYSDSYQVYTAIRTSTNEWPSDSDSEYWIDDYYPSLLGIYNPSNNYSLGDVVYVDESSSTFSSSGVYTLAQDAAPHQVTGLYYGYIPNLIGVYDSSQTYQLCDIVLYEDSGNYGCYICISTSSVTGEWDSSCWEIWDGGEVKTLTFKGTPENIGADAFTGSGYNVALVPWPEDEGPDLSSHFEIIIYNYSSEPV